MGWRRCIELDGLACALVVAALGVRADAGDEKILIAPRFAPGQSHYCEWNQSTVSRRADHDPQTKDEPRRFVQLVGILETVESVSPEGHVTLRLTIDRMAHEFLTSAVTQKFDSDFDDGGKLDHPLAPIFRPMIGASMRLSIDREGKVLSFEGMDATFDKIAEQLARQPGAPGVEDKLERLRYMFGSQGGRVMWGESRFSMYPFREVKVGDKWERTLVQPFPTGDFEIRIECRLAAIEGRQDHPIAVVEYEAAMRQKAEAAKLPTDAPPASRYFATNFSGNFKGTARFDARIGQFVADKESGAMELDIPAGPKDPSPNATIHLKQTVDTTTRLMTSEERQDQKQRNRRLVKKGP